MNKKKAKETYHIQKENLLWGALAATGAWGILTLADLIDEKVLDKSTEISAGVFMFLPVITLIYYIVHCIREKPTVKKLLLWFGGYSTVFTFFWYSIGNAVNYGRFFIEQPSRNGSNVIMHNPNDFNGMEYILYGFTMLLAFGIGCLLFHIIHFTVRVIIRVYSNYRMMHDDGGGEVQVNTADSKDEWTYTEINE